MHSVLVVDNDQELRQHDCVVDRFVRLSRRRRRQPPKTRWSAMERDPSNIALCDACMADEDGVWLAWRMRERHPQTAVIVATALRDCESAVSNLRNDVVDYLLKPFDRDPAARSAVAGARLARRGRRGRRAARGAAGSAAHQAGGARRRAGRGADDAFRGARRPHHDAAVSRAGRPRAFTPRGAPDAGARRRAPRRRRRDAAAAWNMAPCCTTSASWTCRPQS